MKQLVMFLLIINIVTAQEDININIVEENCKGQEYDICYNAISDYRLENDREDIDWKLIKKLYINLCDNVLHAKSCRSLGTLYGPSPSIKLNWEKSAKYYTKACQLNDMIACNNLGVMYKYGEFYKKDYKKALELFTKSCNNKDHEAVDKACSNKEELIELMKNLDELELSDK